MNTAHSNNSPGAVLYCTGISTSSHIHHIPMLSVVRTALGHANSTWAAIDIIDDVGGR
jgi:hypothetical protein